MNELLFVTLDDAGEGFRLTGVRQRRTTAADALTVYREALADSSVGVIAMDERLVEAIGEDRVAALAAAWPGILVTLPAPQEAEGVTLDPLQRLVRRALGYHVRLES